MNEDTRKALWREYHDYVRSVWEAECAAAGIGPPIHMLKLTAYPDGSTAYLIGNDPPGPSITVRYWPGELLDPPPLPAY